MVAGIQKAVKVAVVSLFRATLTTSTEPLFGSFNMFHICPSIALFFLIVLLLKPGIHCYFVHVIFIYLFMDLVAEPFEKQLPEMFHKKRCF